MAAWISSSLADLALGVMVRSVVAASSDVSPSCDEGVGSGAEP